MIDRHSLSIYVYIYNISRLVDELFNRQGLHGLYRFTYMESEKFKSQHAKGSVSLDDIYKMTSSRVIKTHLPFYLLHPRLFDICKVWTARLDKFIKKSQFNSDVFHQVRQFMLPAILKMWFCLIIIIISSSSYSISKEIWKLLLSTLWITKAIRRNLFIYIF